MTCWPGTGSGRPIGDLTVRSPDFAEMWAAHRVKAGADATYDMRHPLVGALTVTQQALRTEQGRTVVITTTEPDSPSRAAMSLLAHSIMSAPDSRVRPG